MTDVQLYTQISTLPSELKKQVSEFVSSLKKKSKNVELKERKFGAGKNFFRMSDDFDAPLSDFKEYM
jgi:hypothetical protein